MEAPSMKRRRTRALLRTVLGAVIAGLTKAIADWLVKSIL